MQGAAESPFLWILFYDMVLCQLRREDMGKSVTLSGEAGEQVQAGLSAFADDTAFLERTAAGAQRSALVVEEVLALVCLKLAPAKSLHMAATYVDTADSGRLSCRTVNEIPVAGRVVIGGVLVPLVGADEGLRYLGFQMDVLFVRSHACAATQDWDVLFVRSCPCPETFLLINPGLHN